MVIFRTKGGRADVLVSVTPSLFLILPDTLSRAHESFFSVPCGEKPSTRGPPRGVVVSHAARDFSSRILTNQPLRRQQSDLIEASSKFGKFQGVERDLSLRHLSVKFHWNLGFNSSPPDFLLHSPVPIHPSSQRISKTCPSFSRGSSNCPSSRRIFPNPPQSAPVSAVSPGSQSQVT